MFGIFQDTMSMLEHGNQFWKVFNYSVIFTKCLHDKTNDMNKNN